jgi:hypothetical protein
MECCGFTQTEPIGSRSNFLFLMTHTSFSSSKGVISVLSALGAVATGLRGIPGDGPSVAPHRGAMEDKGESVLPLGAPPRNREVLCPPPRGGLRRNSSLFLPHGGRCASELLAKKDRGSFAGVGWCKKGIIKHTQ